MDVYANIITAANWSAVGTDGVTVAVALAAVFVIFRGARLLVSFIRR